MYENKNILPGRKVIFTLKISYYQKWDEGSLAKEQRNKTIIKALIIYKSG